MVLHSTPIYKRQGYDDEHDSKKHCRDGCSGKIFHKPQVGGSLRVDSRKQDAYGKYSIPIFRGNKERVGVTSQGVAEAVATAGEPPSKNL